MKKPFLLLPFLFVFAFLSLFSCKKVNEATLLGDSLVPEVDNINTFDTTFDVETDNVLLNDTAKVGYTYPVALGNIANDPEFGATNAAVYFQISPSIYGTYPFKAAREKVLIDSIVLSVSYIGSYGDTNVPITVRVYEVTKESTFNDTTLYGYSHPHFQTTGVELGSTTFQMSKLDDSVLVVHGDTIKVANQLRIKLDNSLAERFRNFDTTKNPATGGYNNDTLFKDLFRGIALKADEGSGNGLAYLDLSNAKTGITIFYRTLVDNKEDTLETGFGHIQRLLTTRTASQGGQANIITRQRSGGWDAYLANGLPQDDKLYIQSAPGSAGYIKIPGLNGFGNRLIHRAELIATRIPISPNDVFDAPDQLFVAKMGGQDSAFIFHEYLIPSNTGGIAYNFNSFGGKLRTDDTYRFNITTAVQDILSRDSSNYTLRIYAPFTTAPLDVRTRPAVPRLIQVGPFPAYGRVLLAGGNYENHDKRMRLRVIYSKLQP